jgi:hypothetical protein
MVVLFNQLAGLAVAILGQRSRIDITLGKGHTQHVQQLLQLELLLGTNGNALVIQLNVGFHVLEVPAITQLPLGLVDRIGDFVHIDF